MDDTAEAPQPEATGDNPNDPVLERFWEMLRRLPCYVALGVNLVRDNRVPGRAKTTVTIGGIYAVSPVDLVPGIIPVAGQLDDMIVLLVTLRRAIRACPPSVAAEHLNRAGLTTLDFDEDLATCRATARWLAMKGLRFGGRVAAGARRLLWATIQSRADGGR